MLIAHSFRTMKPVTLKLLLTGLVEFGLLQLGVCDQSSDDWSTVVDTVPYGSLPNCAKGCLLNVNSFTNCKDYSCVCSGQDPLGTNFIANYNNISACAQQDCDSGTTANQAGNAFKDICAVAVNLSPGSTTVSSTPIPTIITSLANITVTVSPTPATQSYLSATLSTIATPSPIPSCK